MSGITQECLPFLLLVYELQKIWYVCALLRVLQFLQRGRVLFTKSGEVQ